MDYLALAKRAFKITIENKFLWIFGFFLGGVGGYSGYTFSSPLNNKSDKVDDAQINAMLNQLTTYYQTHTMAVLVIALFALLLMVVFIILSILSQGALISSVARLNKDEKVNFWIGLREGAKYFWRIWGLMIVYSLIMLGVIVVLGLPFIATITSSNIIFTLLWGIIVLFVFLAAALIISFIAPYSQRLVVLENNKIIESIENGFGFAKKHLVNLLVVYLILMAIGVIFVIAVSVTIMIIAMVLVLVGMAISLASAIAGVIFASLCAIAFLLTIFVIAGAYSAYQSAILTLAYEQLKHKTN